MKSDQTIFRNKYFIAYFILAIIILALVNYFLWPRTGFQRSYLSIPRVSESDGIKVCTETVRQPECYNQNNDYLELSWDCRGGEDNKNQYNFIIQVAKDENFIRPIINIKEKDTVVSNYRISKLELEGGVLYFWRIKVQNNDGIWSEWAAHEEPFIFAPDCE